MVYPWPEDTAVRFMDILMRSGLSHQQMAYLLEHPARIGRLVESIAVCEPVQPIAIENVFGETRLINLLRKHGYKWLFSIACADAEDIQAIDGIGPIWFGKIHLELEKRGWHFGMKPPKPIKKK